MNNILYNVSTPTCVNATASSSGSLIIPAYRQHQHRDYITQSKLYIHPPSKQLPRIVIITLDSSQRFYRVYFIINYKHFNILNLLSFIILIIFVILAK